MRLRPSITAGLCTAALFFAAEGATAEPPGAVTPAAAKDPKKPAINIIVSKETTVITEPLTKDGYPDYLEWLNRKYSQGVTPQNNAAVLLFQIVGPRDVPEKIRPEYFRRLGVPMPPVNGDYLVEPEEFYKGQRRRDLTIDERRLFYRQFDQASRRPWTEREFPKLAQWLIKSERHLSPAMEMTRRPKLYSPLVATSDTCPMIGADMLAFGSQTSIARALVIRAMFRLGKHDLQGCWDDLVAVERWSRLISSGPSWIDQITAAAMLRMIAEPVASVAHEGRPSSAQCLMFRKQLMENAPQISIAKSLDEWERFTILDAACWMARQPLGGMTQTIDFGQGVMSDVVKSLLPDSLIDWNVVLKMCNDAYDQLIAAVRIENGKKRWAAIRKVNDKLETIRKATKDSVLLVIAMSWLDGESHGRISKYVGASLLNLMMPAIGAGVVLEDRAATVGRMNDLILALAAYRSDHGKYPESLALLKPQYLRAVPTDAYDGAEFRYTRTADGFRLYSIGLNGKDDGGRGYNDDPLGDDDLIQVPPPKPK